MVPERLVVVQGRGKICSHSAKHRGAVQAPSFKRECVFPAQVHPRGSGRLRGLGRRLAAAQQEEKKAP